MAVTLGGSVALPGDAEREASPVLALARFFGNGLLRSYAQILLSRSRLVGALLLLATAVSPRLLLFGAGSVLVGLAVARILRLSETLAEDGLLTYSALLVGVAGAALLPPTTTSAGLVVAAAAASVLVTAALHSLLFGVTWLPALTLPFLAVVWLLLGGAPALGLPLVPLGADPWHLALPEPVTFYLRSLGALFFLPRIDAGLLVLLALLVFSRIGTVLSVLGFAVAWVVVGTLPGLAPEQTQILFGYNFVLTAVALGGVWFVPSPSAFLLAAGSVLLCAGISVGVLPVVGSLGLPLLILPFNLTVLLVLQAMRQRTRDGAPKAVDFLLGTPEENLHYYRTRLARFGAQYAARLRAPFLGRWTCTQGVDGPTTHRGPWRHAFDFEVMGPDGKAHRGGGRERTDYHCYRLPVVAPADGVVVKVVDGVPDNAVGEVNLEDNWGNLVVVRHGPALCSLVAHLAPGSIPVREGQHVRRGHTLGLCGSSGRSPVPHLHFQLQATERVGAPTLEAELHDVVSVGEAGEALHGTRVPEVGEVVRNLDARGELARHLRLAHGDVLRFEEDGGRPEDLVAEIDLYGNLRVRSSRGPVLHYDADDALFTAFDVTGGHRTVLWLWQVALARLPFEAESGLTWTDHLALRHFLPWPLRVLADFASPFLPALGLQMRYRARREAGRLRVEGASRRTRKDGTPRVATVAVLGEEGIERLEVAVRGRTRQAVRRPAPRRTRSSGGTT